MNRRITIEVCVSDVESAIAAEVGGADRVELCDNLAVGGTTASAGTIAEVCRWLSIPVHVFIRPRGGDFVYSERELAVMRHDIEAAKALGAAGVVLGVLTAKSTVDRDITMVLVEAARPLSVTFHRAIDQTPEPREAVDALVALGVERVLTSGGCTTALEGASTIAGLVKHAQERISIMAGGRINTDNLEAIVRQTAASEIHIGSALYRTMATPSTSLPGDTLESSWNRTDAQRVAGMVSLIEELFGAG
jgi:copper homeostasis protein